MSAVTTQFRLKLDDPFQARLDEAIKTLRHGTRNSFLVNLCRALFGGMEAEQMKKAMAAIGYSQESALEELLAAATARYELSKSFQAMREMQAKRPPPPAPIAARIPPKVQIASLKSLSIGDD